MFFFVLLCVVILCVMCFLCLVLFDCVCVVCMLCCVCFCGGVVRRSCVSDGSSLLILLWMRFWRVCCWYV